MATRINFEDNIYLIAVCVRFVDDAMLLDSSDELFQKKLISDLQFAGESLAVLLARLQENAHLIDKNDQYNNLSSLEWDFANCCTRFMQSSFVTASADHASLSDRIKSLKKASEERQKTLEQLENLAGGNSEHLISRDEFHELMKPLN